MEITPETFFAVGSAVAAFIANWAVMKSIITSHDKILDQHRIDLTTIYGKISALEASRVLPDDHDELAEKVAAIDVSVQLQLQAQRNQAQDIREIKTMLIGLISGEREAKGPLSFYLGPTNDNK